MRRHTHTLLLPLLLVAAACSSAESVPEDGLQSELSTLSEPGGQERGSAREPGTTASEPEVADRAPVNQPFQPDFTDDQQRQNIPPPPANSQSIVTIAIVNDQTLTSLEVERTALGMAMTRQQQGLTVTDNDYQQLRFLAFRDMVLDMLFREGFRASGMEEDLLDRIVADEMRKAIDQAGSMAAYAAQLEQVNRTIDEETLGLRRFFTSLLYLQMEQGLMPSGKGQGPKARLYVRPNDVREFYQRNRSRYEREYRVTARMILIRDVPDQDPAEQRLRSVESAIRSGSISFADAAREHSNYKASVGGSLGTITPDDTQLPLQQPIRDFLNSAQAGDISAPIEVTAGWVLVMAENVFPGGTAPFEEVQFEILGELMGEHRNDLLRQALNQLLDRCYVWGDGVHEAVASAFPEPKPAVDEDEF